MTHDQTPTISGSAIQIRSGELLALDLVERCLKRIEGHENQIHAWVRIDDERAIADAKKLDGLAHQKLIVGPLHGIPIAVKDIIDIAGQPTLAGSPLRLGHVAERDARIVELLRSSGAILLGKTVTTEFACFDPPPTRNPWNVARSPGGSSSGSAAAVAAGMCLGAIGSQTGGSIVRPASFCGVAGLKPSHGLVDVAGVVPLSHHLDHVGPIARTAADLRILLGVIAGTQLVAARRENHWTFLRFREFFEEKASPEIRQATDHAIASLQAAGAEVIETRLPPSFAGAHAAHRTIMAVEAAEFHREAYEDNPQGYSHHIGKLIADGLQTRGIEFAAALAHQRRFRAEMQEVLGGRIALMPSTSATAPSLDSTGDPSFQSPWSLAGIPAGTIPCGLSQGLPCGLQFVGNATGSLGEVDYAVLDAMEWAETVLRFPYLRLAV